MSEKKIENKQEVKKIKVKLRDEDLKRLQNMEAEIEQFNEKFKKLLDNCGFAQRMIINGYFENYKKVNVKKIDTKSGNIEAEIVEN